MRGISWGGGGRAKNPLNSSAKEEQHPNSLCRGKKTPNITKEQALRRKKKMERIILSLPHDSLGGGNEELKGRMDSMSPSRASLFPTRREVERQKALFREKREGSSFALLAPGQSYERRVYFHEGKRKGSVLSLLTIKNLLVLKGEKRMNLLRKRKKGRKLFLSLPAEAFHKPSLQARRKKEKKDCVMRSPPCPRRKEGGSLSLTSRRGSLLPSQMGEGLGWKRR